MDTPCHRCLLELTFNLCMDYEMCNVEVWNPSYSWGPMSADCQMFAGSWGRNFVGNCFVALQHRSFQRSWGRTCKFMIRVTHEIIER